MSEQLKPCPFCGIPGAIKDDWDSEAGGCLVTVSCNNETCKMEVSTPLIVNEAEAVAAWNRRASPWRNFREQRPEDGQECLIHWKAEWGATYIETSYYSAKVGLFDSAAHDIVPHHVKWLFWMPLPAAPSAEEIERAMK